MQQTETYKLNKPETTDNFTPAPLNENADKIEAALAAETAARQALDGRVQVLEVRKFAAGTYQGNGVEGRIINVGFTPQAVFAFHQSIGNCSGLAVPGIPGRYVSSGKSSDVLTVVENGFKLGSLGRLNSDGINYTYFVFA